MSPRRARGLAWGLAALALALQVAGNLGYVATGADFAIQTPFVSAIAIAFATVGALVATWQPRNAIGWIFLGVGVSAGFGAPAHSFVEYRLQSSPDPGALDGAAAAYADVSWIPFVLVPATFLLALFPDGHLPSRRWRYVAWSAAAGIALSLFSGTAGIESFSDYPTVKNPVFIDSQVMGPLEGLGFLLLMVGIVGSAASVVVRFRRAGRVERQQIKWLATASATVAVTFPIMLMLYDVVGAAIADSTIMFTVLGLPVAAGIAILRHRLYDIDVVINRALVYGALSATLAGAYLGSVLLLQLVLSGLIAGSGLAVAGSTLAIAGLFRPARSRIQTTVDRRFFRRKYDAARTLERFGAHLRDEVDLDALGDELRTVIRDTMQPAHVTLWLRETRTVQP